MIDTNALRKLCKSATPGPWEWCCWDNDSFEIVSGGFDSEGRVIGSTVVQPDASDEEGCGGVKRREDADYISAANPATVLALLDELDRLRTIEAAALNLAKVKGRHNSEIAYNRLMETLK